MPLFLIRTNKCVICGCSKVALKVPHLHYRWIGPLEIILYFLKLKIKNEDLLFLNVTNHQVYSNFLKKNNIPLFISLEIELTS